MGEVKMTRCQDECGKKWRIGKQTKPGRERRKEENLIELRVTEEMVS